MRRFFRIIGVLLAVLVPNQLRADHLYAYRDVVEDAYDFLVYIPDSYYNSDKPLPLLLNLHGRSLTGNDLNMVTRYGCIDALRRGRKIEAVVVCPQCRTTGGWDPEKLMNAVDWVRYNFRTDHNRLYVFGISMGGWGTFKFAAAYPDQVAAAIGMCGGSTGPVEPLSRLPLWIIHGTSDRVTEIYYSTSVVEKMARTGKSGRLYFTWLTGCDHSILARVFLLPQAYDWLFAHSLKDRDRQVNRDFRIVPRDLDAAYMHLDQSRAQRLPIQEPYK